MLNSIYNTDMVKVLDNRRSQRQEKQPVMSLHEDLNKIQDNASRNL